MTKQTERNTAANIDLAIVWAASCKFKFCNSIGHSRIGWADVIQMPHHRQYVNRYMRCYV